MSALPATCPKCATALVDGALACKRCGLTSANMAAYTQSRDEVPPRVVAAWEGVVSHWDEVARHDALLALVAQTESYAWAAAQYRERERMLPDDPIARRQLERLRRAAEVTLYASAAARPDKASSPFSGIVVVLLVLALVMVGIFAYTKLGRGRQALPGPQPGTLQPPPRPGDTWHK